jgi:hypothetical protein
MRIHPATPALVAIALTVAATLSVTAQNQPIANIARTVASARTSVTKAAVSRMKASTFTTIQGNALTSTNGPLNDIIVRLRDARFGTIIGSQTTDKSGMFEFKSVDPGSYIVEVMATNDQSAVLAASQLLNINAGEAVSAVVKLPFRIPPFAGILGSTSMPSAAAVAGQAAASGVVSLVPTAPVSPTQ